MTFADQLRTYRKWVEISLSAWLVLLGLLFAFANQGAPASAVTTLAILMVVCFLAFHALLANLARLLGRSGPSWCIGALLFGPISALIACALLHRITSQHLSLL